MLLSGLQSILMEETTDFVQSTGISADEQTGPEMLNDLSEVKQLMGSNL